MTNPAETHRAIEAVWKIEAPRLIAGLARFTRDVGLAEELAQNALMAAFRHSMMRMRTFCAPPS